MTELIKIDCNLENERFCIEKNGSFSNRTLFDFIKFQRITPTGYKIFIVTKVQIFFHPFLEFVFNISWFLLWANSHEFLSVVGFKLKLSISVLATVHERNLLLSMKRFWSNLVRHCSGLKVKIYKNEVAWRTVVQLNITVVQTFDQTLSRIGTCEFKIEAVRLHQQYKFKFQKANEEN